MSDKHKLEGEHGHREVNVAGLTRRHVKRIQIEWEDKPPSDIAEQRLQDIMQALRLGFERIEDFREQTVEALAQTEGRLALKEDRDANQTA